MVESTIQELNRETGAASMSQGKRQEAESGGFLPSGYSFRK
jgi:hypothetical protein